MVTFGFSAFLKILSLNDKPQKTEIRKRLAPSEDAYDFHRRMRLYARQYLVDGVPISEVVAAAEGISPPAERKSAVDALERLAAWRAAAPGVIMNFGTAVFKSPQHLFKVKFEPVFGLHIHGRTTAFHIWNTQKPQLSPAATYAALSLIAEVYENQDGGPEDVAVLSLRELTSAYFLANALDHSLLAASLVERVEDLLGEPSFPPTLEDQPNV